METNTEPQEKDICDVCLKMSYATSPAPVGSFPEMKCFSNANYTVKEKKRTRMELVSFMISASLWCCHHFQVNNMPPVASG